MRINLKEQKWQAQTVLNAQLDENVDSLSVL